MRTLITFYSRTANTRKIAKELSKSLKGELEEIKAKGFKKGSPGSEKQK